MSLPRVPAPAGAAAVPPLRVEAIAAHPQFRRLDTLQGVLHDLRYASRNNFAGVELYRGMDCAWLRVEAAAGLEAAAAWLARQRPGWRIVVLDALRPQRVQEAIWAQAEGTAMEVYFANPAVGSIHSFGMAVDVTLVDPQGDECDMGAGFDEMTLRSHPSLNAENLALGVLNAGHLVERGWLHAAMSRGGFRGIGTEWWHFDHGDRERVRREWPRVI